MMTSRFEGDGIAAAVRDPAIALGLLTRLPMRVDPRRAAARGGRAAWAWPLAGLVPGGAAAAILAAGTGLPPGVAAALALASACLLTGALHEDGLADMADGVWGAHDAAGRLEIMRDSRIGAYGACALVLTFLLRWAALTALAATGAWIGALIAAVASRAAMTALAGLLPPARPGGLGASVGRPGRNAMLGAGILGVAACGLAPDAALAAIISVVAVTAGVSALARAKVGGQTGDVLGAAQVLAECAVLTVLASRL